MEQPSGIGTFSSNQAKMILEQLGYEDITTVPVGRGNDYLSAMVRIVGGGI